ncbi:MAG: histidine phosphatase family protein, partial [Dehalococcoidia bacterium]|nr:histidine phosphatase family protein [Dehalococcoidia bacterium]
APQGLHVSIERDLREVEGRAWSGDEYQEQVRRYLSGEGVGGWEPRAAVLGRVNARIADLLAGPAGSGVAAVSHGLALTLYLSDLLGLDAAASFELWSTMAFPDVAIVDHETRRFERSFGERAAVR